MPKKVLKVFFIIFALSLFLLQAGCKESNRVNTTIVPVSTKDCYSTTFGTDERIAVFKILGGGAFEMTRAYAGGYKFDNDCNIESMNMDVALINGELSPTYEFDNPTKELSSAILKNSPRATLILYFPDAQSKPRSLRAIRAEAKCSPKFTLPELGIEYFTPSREGCGSYSDGVPQFFFSDVEHNYYNATIYCGIPKELEATDLIKIDDLNSFNYIQGYGCRGHGSINPNGNQKQRIDVNYQYIDNKGLPHIDVTKKIIRFSSELISESVK